MSARPDPLESALIAAWNAGEPVEDEPQVTPAVAPAEPSGPLSPERLAEIAVGEAAARLGPWRVVEDRESLTRWVSSEDGTLDIGFGYVGNRTQGDAAFVAAARTDVPALLADNARLTARVAELEDSPLAWAEQLDLKSLDNLLISLGQASDYEPMTGAIDQIHEALRGFRAALTPEPGDRS